MQGDFSKLRTLCSQEGMTASTFRIPVNCQNQPCSTSKKKTAIVKMFGGYPLSWEKNYTNFNDIFTPMETELEAYEKLKDLQGNIVPQLLGYGMFDATEADYRGWCIMLEDVGSKRPLRSSQSHYTSAKNGVKLIHELQVAGFVSIGSMGLRKSNNQVVFYDFAQTKSQKFKYLYLNDVVYLSRIFGI